MAPVATFTAVDPEGESIVWSLADSGDPRWRTST